MKRRARGIPAVILLTASVALSYPAAAQAQVANLYPLTIGDRAFGFAGAFTSLASDATAGWYNPAGLGFIDKTYINATGNVYGYDHATADDFITLEPSTGERGSAKLDEEQYRATPTTFAIAKTFGTYGTASFGVYVPRDIDLDDNVSTSVDFGPFHTDYLEKDKYTSRDIYFGPSFGYRINEHVALGASAFIMKSVTDSVFLMDIITDPIFRTSSSMEKVSYWGARFGLGAKAEYNQLRLGLNLFFPTLRIDEHTERTTVNSGMVSVENDTFDRDTSDAGRGWNMAAGIGWEEKGHWAAELDVTYYKPEFKKDIAERNVVNVQAGGEYALTPNYYLRAGFFTDFSAHRVDSASLPMDIDLYGTTLQLCYQDKIPNSNVSRSFSIGVRYAFGSGDVTGATFEPDTGNLTTPKRDLDYQSINVVLGGTLSY